MFLCEIARRVERNSATIIHWWRSWSEVGSQIGEGPLRDLDG